MQTTFIVAWKIHLLLIFRYEIIVLLMEFRSQLVEKGNITTNNNCLSIQLFVLNNAVLGKNH